MAEIKCMNPWMPQSIRQYGADGKNDTLTSTDYKDPCIIAYPVQNHPQDSRVTIEEDASAIQTLSAKMGTGGGNTPLVLITSFAADSRNTSLKGSPASGQAVET